MARQVKSTCDCTCKLQGKKALGLVVTDYALVNGIVAK